MELSVTAATLGHMLSLVRDGLEAQHRHPLRPR
jgi:hypothetical protein